MFFLLQTESREYKETWGPTDGREDTKQSGLSATLLFISQLTLSQGYAFIAGATLVILKQPSVHFIMNLLTAAV